MDAMEGVVNLLRENKYGDAAKACERIELEVSGTERARTKPRAPHATNAGVDCESAATDPRSRI